MHLAASISNKVNADTVSVKTNLDSEINLTGHSCAMTVKLTEYVTQQHVENFKVIIKYCKIVTYATTGTIAAQPYIIYYDTEG